MGINQESSFNGFLKELQETDRVTVSSNGDLEVDNGAVGELILKAARDNQLIEVLGVSGQNVVLRSRRRLENFSIDVESLGWNGRDIVTSAVMVC